MTILHIIPSLEMGGAQKMLAELVDIQIKLGHSVSVLVYKTVSSKYEHMIRNSGCKLIDLEEHYIKSPRVVFKIRKYITGFDIVHVHLFPALYQVVFANIGLKNILVYTEHSTHNRRRDLPLLKPVERCVYSKYDSIIAISQKTKDNLEQWLGAKQAKKNLISVIHNGIDLKTIKNASMPQIPGIDRYILMVSRFMPAKDQATLIRSIPHINDRNIKILFAGDGDTLHKNKALADSLGVINRCHFLGSRNDVPSLIKGCILGVQSSHWEGFGLTAVEFMAAGKPIIASDVKGLSGVVAGAGDLFYPGNEIDLASKINSLIEDPALYNKRATACIERAKQYDINIMAQKYDELYLHLSSFNR